MTNYRKHISYVTHDVTDMLTMGQNAIAVMLGNGWYSEPGRERYGNSPTLLAQMNITFIDGDTMSIKTDTSWTASAGPITRNGIQGGTTRHGIIP
jgi:alpha-L-rhamnosidase